MPIVIGGFSDGSSSDGLEILEGKIYMLKPYRRRIYNISLYKDLHVKKSDGSIDI